MLQCNADGDKIASDCLECYWFPRKPKCETIKTKSGIYSAIAAGAVCGQDVCWPLWLIPSTVFLEGSSWVKVNVDRTIHCGGSLTSWTGRLIAHHLKSIPEPCQKRAQ